MSTSRRRLGIATPLAAVATCIFALSLWQTIRLTRENGGLREAVSELRPRVGFPSRETANDQPDDLPKAHAELERARVRLRSAEDRVKGLAAELAITPAEELKSFGKIEKLALEGVKLVNAIQQLSQVLQAAEPDGRRLSPGPFLEDMPQWFMHTDAIGELEADPAEIADLQARALREMLGFDEIVSRGVREQLTTTFDLLRAQGFDRPHRPIEGQDEWYANRDRILLEASKRIELLIPAPQRKPNAVAQIMNLGSGFRTQLIPSPNGRDFSLKIIYKAPGSPPIRF